MSDSKRGVPASDPFLNAGDFQEDLGMFEAATHAPAVELSAVALRTILAVPDGSNQNDTVRATARLLAEAMGARVVEAPVLTTAAAIQSARREHGADLLAIPIPFGSDYSELGEVSLGDVVDRILAESPPILAVRQPLDEAAIRAALRNAVVPLSPENPRTAEALGWAVRILDGSGALTAIEIADSRLRAEASAIEGGTGPAPAECVDRVLTRYFAGSIAATQRKAVEVGFNLRVVCAANRFVDAALAALNGDPGLVILAGSADRRSDAYHHEADLILASRYPVLIV